ncbi:hypothetical protein LMH87_004357 [Akanthomyces muscarius]|uniref:Mid2 domain-containing protein n=1 Tax=Akanthomyces muscarius TaxID=2231603 RepID=A0A9W8Q571_AKAMU|nr:hypothetical protein LMH87_004357 [Akanthomyces muscarius]KAJ4145509.1 hypothetical protein LMH87_004357 [Akanthomyces muscarius]
MPSCWAVLGSVLVAIQPIAASHVPESPNNVEQTNAAVASNYLLGVSPRITDAPFPDPRSLAGRADAFDRNTDTCGFYSDGFPLRCFATTATCGYGSKFAACCAQGTTCSTFFTGCYGFTDALNGSCSSAKLKTEPQMACCYDRSTPNCVLHTLVVSSTSLGVWGCATTLTGETIYTTNPFLKTTSDSTSSSRTRSSSTPQSTSTSTTTTTSASGSSTSSSAADKNSGIGGEKKSNTGAIVGGVVGGVGALAIIGAAIFFFMRSRKKKSVDNSPNAAAAAQPMLHHPQQSPPPPGQGSPFGYHHPQGGSPAYDPNMAYQHYQGGGSPQPYPPPSQSPYDPRQSGYAGWGQQPSPGAMGSTSPSHTASGPHHGPAVELSDSRATGTGGNRAELG